MMRPAVVLLLFLPGLTGAAPPGCAPADMMAFAAPGEVRDLKSIMPTLLAWRAETGRSGPGTTCDFVRGSLTSLAAGPGPAGVCVADGLFRTDFSDTSSPAVGTGSYFFVRGANSCGIGTYGFATTGTERTTAICP